MFHNTTATLNLRLQKLITAIGLLLVLVTFALPDAALAQTVTRGPYLQSGAPDSIVVRWRTDIASESVVRYGSSPAQLNSLAETPGATTEHEVKLSLLDPATIYFYSVGTRAQALAGGDNDHMFTTSPLAGTEQPTRIWVVGDSGTANANARAVRDAYLTLTGSQYTHLFLMLGDNAYNDGTDSEYQAAVFDTYPSILRQTPLWPTLGNHDGRSANSNNESGVYYDIFTLPRNGEVGGLASGTEAYYSFDYANIHFIVLESFETDRSANGPMMNWLRDDVAAQDQPWVIAFWHHPPYSKGSHNSDSETALIEMRQNALPILEDAGVDLVLGGHSHSYERSFLIDGHYGNSNSFNAGNLVDAGNGQVNGDGAYEKPGDFIGDPHQGAVYVVAGSSGQISGGSLNHPAMVVNLNQLGSMVLEINGDTLDATFLNNDGQQPDTFRIVKALSLPEVSAIASDPTATEAGPTSGAFTINRVGDSSAALTVNYTVGGTATSGADYIALSGSVSLAAGATSATINVNPLDDPLVERNETVVLTLSTNAAYQIGTPGSATVAIESDEFPPVITISATTPTATEAGPTNGAFTVSRVGDSSNALTVGYTVDGTATSGADYTALSGSVTIAAGQTSGVISITPIDDSEIEPDETVLVTLSANTALYDLGTPDNASVTIVSNEIPPQVNIAASDDTATEAGPTSGEFTVTRSLNTTDALTVNYTVGGTATADSDYTALSGSVNLAAGVTTAVISVNPIDDTAFEPDETVVVTLTTSTLYVIGASANATVTIESDDLQPPEPVTLTVANVFDNKNNKNYFPGGPNGADPFNEIISLTENQNLEVEHGSSFWWQIGFEDPAAGQTNLTNVVVDLSYRAESDWNGNFQAEYRVGSQVLASIDLPVNGSSLNNFNWDLSSVVTSVSDLTDGEVRLTNSGGNGKKIFANFAALQATFNGGTPPVLPTVSITASDATATEAGPTNGAFTVNRVGDTSAALTVNYTVNGTATSGADYIALGGSVTIAAGQTSAAISIVPVDDAEVEVDESVIVTLSADATYTVGAANSDTVTITSNDQPASTPVTLSVVNLFDNKNGKNYFPGGPDGTDPLDDINSLAEEDKVEVLGDDSSFWWEAQYADPDPILGDPSEVIVTLNYRPEAGWTGTFTVEYRVGTTVLASSTMPGNSSGNTMSFTWDLSSVVTTSSDLANGRLRFLNTDPGGKKVFVSFSSTDATLGGGTPSN